MKGSHFINYAHRGASAYLPENTLLSFYTGIYMGANGIETDIQRAKDGTLVLFHDDTLQRLTGAPGAINDYTFDELQQFDITNQGYRDKIPSFEDFLRHFSFRDMTFAIELKGSAVEADTAALLRKYHMEAKAVVTSFHLDYLRRFRKIAPEFQTGYLAKEVTDDLITQLTQLRVEELCPKAEHITAELVRHWHGKGFRVRAWGVADEALMRHVYDCGADGMTVNFPDRLAGLLNGAL